MLLDYSKKNIALLGVAQAGVILMGMMACGATWRLCREAGREVPTSTYVLAHWGWVGLVVPLAWAILAVLFFCRSDMPDMAEAWIPIVGLGIAVVLALAGFYGFAAGLIRATAPIVTM